MQDRTGQADQGQTRTDATLDQFAEMARNDLHHSAVQLTQEMAHRPSASTMIFVSDKGAI
jgi:hypothetical protein